MNVSSFLDPVLLSMSESQQPNILVVWCNKIDYEVEQIFCLVKSN